MTDWDGAGIYAMSAAEYHADSLVPGGSLSSSGARRLVWPSTPARFRYEQDHPAEPTDAMDFGNAAHKIILADGEEDLIIVVEAENWRTKDAQEQKKAARAAGKPAILTKHREAVHAMAEQVRSHPLAGALLHPSAGKVEQSAFWRDGLSGIWRRARFDLLPDAPSSRGRYIVRDYKTAVSADPNDFGKAAAQHGYHQQDCWYRDAARAVLDLGETEVTFLFVVQEKAPPYLVNVIELDDESLFLGDIANRSAIDTYKACTESGEWPGYRPGVALASLPAYFTKQFEEEMSDER